MQEIYTFFIILVKIVGKRIENKRQNDSQDNFRNSILEYAWSEFVKMGLKKVKVDDLAAHFSISKRTLYEMFKDKENLIIECFRNQFKKNEKIYEEIQKNAENILEVYIGLFVQRMLEIKNINPVFFSDAFKYTKLMEFFNQTADERNELFLRVVRLCVEQGFLQPHFNYKMLLEVYHFQMLNVVMYELYKKYDIHDILKTIQLVNFRGCCTKKGLQVFDSKFEDILGLE